MVQTVLGRLLANARTDKSRPLFRETLKDTTVNLVEFLTRHLINVGAEWPGDFVALRRKRVLDSQSPHRWLSVARLRPVYDSTNRRQFGPSVAAPTLLAVLLTRGEQTRRPCSKVFFR